MGRDGAVRHSAKPGGSPVTAADLAIDAALRERFMGMIGAEFERTRAMMTEIFRGTFEERRPRLAFTLQIREQALVQLHRQQVALLKDWRQLNGREAETMLPDLLLSINAISSGRCSGSYGVMRRN